MAPLPIQSFLGQVDQRRRDLGMPWDALAARSGVSRATVCRLLKDRQTTASLQNVLAVAEALGISIQVDDGVLRSNAIDLEDFIEQQAERQARRLVGMVRGTMGLEGQALAEEESLPLIKKTKRKLLGGPLKNLWYE